MNLIIGVVWGLAIVISILLGKVYNNYLFSLIFLLPLQEIINQVIQYVLSKIVKPKLLPKIDLQNKITKEQATMVVIPTIIDSDKKWKKCLKN